MTLKTRRELKLSQDSMGYLQKFEDAVLRLSKSHHGRLKRTLKPGNPKDCRQSIFTTDREIFCGLLREGVNVKTCKYCPLFDSEPSAYRLFLRV